MRHFDAYTTGLLFCSNTAPRPCLEASISNVTLLLASMSTSMSMSLLRLVSSFLHKKRLVLDQAALPCLITRDRNSSLCMKQLFHSRPSHMRLVDRQSYNSLIIKYECPYILAIAFLKSSSIVKPSARGQSRRSGHHTRLPYKGIVLHGRVQILLVRFRKWPFSI